MWPNPQYDDYEFLKIWRFLFVWYEFFVFFSVVKIQQSILRAKEVVLKKSLFIWKVLVTIP